MLKPYSYPLSYIPSSRAIQSLGQSKMKKVNNTSLSMNCRKKKRPGLTKNCRDQARSQRKKKKKTVQKTSMFLSSSIIENILAAQDNL